MVERIKLIMRHYNLSVNAFASKIGSNQVTINQQMNGDRKLSLDTVLKIVNSFELISSEWLLTGKGEMLIQQTMPTFSLNNELIITNKNLSETVKSLSRTIENLTTKSNTDD